MNRITPEQLRCLNTLVSKLHIDKERKVMMVQGYSLNRATSSKDLNVEEATALIKHLKALDPTSAAADKMRKKIISMAHEMGWQVKPGVADIKRINGWCKKFSSKKKSLENHLYEELPGLVTQFENGPYKHYISNV